MLTSYWVTCPNAECHWFGDLLPQTDTQFFRAAAPTCKTVLFQCPRCDHSWRARVVGDDVVPLSLEEKVLPWA